MRHQHQLTSCMFRVYLLIFKNYYYYLIIYYLIQYTELKYKYFNCKFTINCTLCYLVKKLK
jgi:hypothetical protein